MRWQRVADGVQAALFCCWAASWVLRIFWHRPWLGPLGTTAIVLLAAVRVGRWLLRRRAPRPAAVTGRGTGDDVLAEQLERFGPRHADALACVLVDADGDGVPVVRSAFVGCDEHTSFETGSVSKAVTGLAVADAVDRGELALDQPLEDLEPGWRGRPLGGRTMLDLATHTSGLPRLPLTWDMARRVLATGPATNPYAGLAPDRVLVDAGRARLRRGQRYSNLGAAAAGQVTARAAGLDFESLLQRVAGPLGMAATTSRPLAPVTAGRDRDGRPRAPWPQDGYAPAGGVVSTAHDLALLMVALLDGTAPGSWAMREQRHGVGLFWQVGRHAASGRTRSWHNGETGGYAALLEIFPEARRARLLLSNVSDAEALSGLARHLRFDEVAEERGRRPDA